MSLPVAEAALLLRRAEELRDERLARDERTEARREERRQDGRFLQYRTAQAEQREAERVQNQRRAGESSSNLQRIQALVQAGPLAGAAASPPHPPLPGPSPDPSATSDGLPGPAALSTADAGGPPVPDAPSEGPGGGTPEEFVVDTALGERYHAAAPPSALSSEDSPEGTATLEGVLCLSGRSDPGLASAPEAPRLGDGPVTLGPTFSAARASELAHLFNQLRSNEAALLTVGQAPPGDLVALSPTNGFRLRQHMAAPPSAPHLMLSSHGWAIQQDLLEAVLAGHVDLLYIAAVQRHLEATFRENRRLRDLLTCKDGDIARLHARLEAAEGSTQRLVARSRLRRGFIGRALAQIQRAFAGDPAAPPAPNSAGHKATRLAAFILDAHRDADAEETALAGPAPAPAPAPAPGQLPVPALGVDSADSLRAALASLQDSAEWAVAGHRDVLRELEQRVARRRRRRQWERYMEEMEGQVMAGEDVASAVCTVFTLGDRGYVRVRDIVTGLDDATVERLLLRGSTMQSVRFEPPGTAHCPCCRFEFDPARTAASYRAAIDDRHRKARAALVSSGSARSPPGTAGGRPQKAGPKPVVPQNRAASPAPGTADGRPEPRGAKQRRAVSPGAEADLVPMMALQQALDDALAKVAALEEQGADLEAQLQVATATAASEKARAAATLREAEEALRRVEEQLAQRGQETEEARGALARLQQEHDTLGLRMRSVQACADEALDELEERRFADRELEHMEQQSMSMTAAAEHVPFKHLATVYFRKYRAVADKLRKLTGADAPQPRDVSVGGDAVVAFDDRDASVQCARLEGPSTDGVPWTVLAHRAADMARAEAATRRPQGSALDAAFPTDPGAAKPCATPLPRLRELGDVADGVAQTEGVALMLRPPLQAEVEAARSPGWRNDRGELVGLVLVAAGYLGRLLTTTDTNVTTGEYIEMLEGREDELRLLMQQEIAAAQQRAQQDAAHQRALLMQQLGAALDTLSARGLEGEQEDCLGHGLGGGAGDSAEGSQQSPNAPVPDGPGSRSEEGPSVPGPSGRADGARWEHRPRQPRVSLPELMAVLDQDPRGNPLRDRSSVVGVQNRDRTTQAYGGPTRAIAPLELTPAVRAALAKPLSAAALEAARRSGAPDDGSTSTAPTGGQSSAVAAGTALRASAQSGAPGDARIGVQSGGPASVAAQTAAQTETADAGPGTSAAQPIPIVAAAQMREARARLALERVVAGARMTATDAAVLTDAVDAAVLPPEVGDYVRAVLDAHGSDGTPPPTPDRWQSVHPSQSVAFSDASHGGSDGWALRSASASQHAVPEAALPSLRSTVSPLGSAHCGPRHAGVEGDRREPLGGEGRIAALRRAQQQSIPAVGHMAASGGDGDGSLVAGAASSGDGADRSDVMAAEQVLRGVLPDRETGALPPVLVALGFAEDGGRALPDGGDAPERSFGRSATHVTLDVTAGMTPLRSLEAVVREEQVCRHRVLTEWAQLFVPVPLLFALLSTTQTQVQAAMRAARLIAHRREAQRPTVLGHSGLGEWSAHSPRPDPTSPHRVDGKALPLTVFPPLVPGARDPVTGAWAAQVESRQGRNPPDPRGRDESPGTRAPSSPRTGHVEEPSPRGGTTASPPTLPLAPSLSQGVAPTMDTRRGAEQYRNLPGSRALPVRRLPPVAATPPAPSRRKPPLATVEEGTYTEIVRGFSAPESSSPPPRPGPRQGRATKPRLLATLPRPQREGRK